MAYIFIYFGFEGDANANTLSSHGSKWISFMLNIAETMKQNNILGFSHLYDYDRVFSISANHSTEQIKKVFRRQNG